MSGEKTGYKKKHLINGSKKNYWALQSIGLLLAEYSIIKMGTEDSLQQRHSGIATVVEIGEDLAYVF